MLKPMDDAGLRYVARCNAHSVAESWPIISTLMHLCPADYHVHRIEVQKSSRGRRAHVTVTFQRNRATA